MDKRILKNYIYSSMFQLILVFAPLITTPYLTRVLGAEILSINTWTANLVQWFVLFGIMGVNNYGNREIAKIRDNRQKVSQTFFEIFFMQLISLSVSGAIFYAYILISQPQYELIFLIQGITLLTVALDITWFFYGVEDLKKASIRNMLVKVIGIILIFTLIKGPQDLVKFVLINTLTAVLGQIIMWTQLKEYVSFTKVTLKGVFSHYRQNIALFIPQIAISVYSVLDITMLGALYEDLRQVNFYEQAQKFVKMFMFFITSIGSVMLPRIAHTFANKNHDLINVYLQKTLYFAIYMSIPMIFGISALIQNFINWFLPVEYNVVGMMIVFTSPIILFISLSNVFGTQYMVPTGMTKQYTISVLLGAIVNFLINLTLIPLYGAYGAIIGSVSAEFTVTIAQYFFIKDKLLVSVKLKSIMNVILASFVMAVVVSFVGHLGSNFAVNILQIFCGGICYISILFLLRDNFFKEMTQSIINRRA